MQSAHSPRPADHRLSHTASPRPASSPIPLNRRRAFTLLELVVALVILAILAALAIPTFASTIHASKVADVMATAHSVDLSAVADGRLSGATASGINATSGQTYLAGALAELPSGGTYSATPSGDGVSYTITNTTWAISVCLVTSSIPGQTGTVTSGACAGLTGNRRCH